MHGQGTEAAEKRVRGFWSPPTVIPFLFNHCSNEQIRLDIAQQEDARIGRYLAGENENARIDRLLGRESDPLIPFEGC